MATDASAARTRRRGEALEHAIYAAALAELDEVGYGGLTMEGVAGRARTGKAALYRRWPSKRELVLHALRHALPDPPEIAPDRSTRENLLAALSVMSEALAGKTSFPGLAVLGEILREPELRQAFVDTVVAPRLQVIESILRQGAQRAETNPTPDPLIVQIGPATVLHSFVMAGRAPTQDELAHIVDTALMPLLR
jgi:AcrR family transcriptional regulator